MLPDLVWNPGPLTYESGALPIALRGPAFFWDCSGRKKKTLSWDTSNNCHNCPKNRKVLYNIALMHPKDADGMANSVDPDQTAS